MFVAFATYKEVVMAAKDFVAAEKDLLVAALAMYVSSMQRRVVADPDAEGKAVWQKKVDAANALAAKVRL